MLSKISILNWGWSAEVIQLILFVIFDTMEEPLASCMVVHFQVYSKQVDSWSVV